MAKATYLLRKAGELVKEKHYQDAVEVYLQATETDPGDARAWFGLGVCLYRVDNLEVARIALGRARKMGYPRADEALARVEAAELKRAQDGTGAKATVAPSEARRQAAARPAAEHGPPPRPVQRAEHEKLVLDRFLRVMLVENLEGDRQAIVEAVQGTIRDCEVSAVEYDSSTSQTMSGTVHCDVAILDWDTAPDAASGLIQILKIKRPTLLVICLTEKWDPESAVEILEAGADYHLVKGPHFAGTIPLVMAQWAKRDRAVGNLHDAERSNGLVDPWADAVAALDLPVLVVSADLTVTQANQAAMKQFRRGQDEFLGRSYSRLFYGEDYPPDECPVVQALEKGRPASDRLSQGDAGADLHVQAWPVLSYAGKVTSAIVLLRPAGEEESVADDIKTREWLYRNLTERANAGVAMVGPNGRILYANEGLCLMLDQTEEELLAQPVEVVAPPQEQEALQDCLRGAVEQGRAGERLLVQRGDGSTFPAEARVARFNADEGTYLVVTLISVAELEQAEQELWAEAHRLARVLDEGVERLECGVVVINDKGSVTWANGPAADLLGTTKDKLTGQRYLNVLKRNLPAAATNAADFLASLQAAHERKEAVSGLPLALKDGKGPLSCWSTPVEGGTGPVCRVDHFYPAAEAQTIEVTGPTDEDSLAGIAAAEPDLLFTVDEEGKLTWCNPGGVQTAGRSAAELRGLPLADLAAPDERTAVGDLLRRAFDQTGRLQRQDVELATSNGHKRWGQVILVGDAARGAAQGVLRDVTDQRIAQAVRQIVAGEQTD